MTPVTVAALAQVAWENRLDPTVIAHAREVINGSHTYLESILRLETACRAVCAQIDRHEPADFALCFGAACLAIGRRVRFGWDETQKTLLVGVEDKWPRSGATVHDAPKPRTWTYYGDGIGHVGFKPFSDRETTVSWVEPGT